MLPDAQLVYAAASAAKADGLLSEGLFSSKRSRQMMTTQCSIVCRSADTTSSARRQHEQTAAAQCDRTRPSSRL